MKFENKKLEEFENFIQGKKVALIGIGISNLPLIEYFYQKKAKISIFDAKEKEEVSKEILNKVEKYSINTSFGKSYLKKLEGFDLIVRSPSCLPTTDELANEKKRGAILTTEIELFMKMCPCQIIGITGSDGKTTTTTLISKILKEAGYNTYIGGNIGIPVFTKLHEINPEDKVVLELSSFQLMDMETSPNIAVITNITPNHLNVHKDYNEYIEAKKNIFKYQDENGILILNSDNEITKKFDKEANGKVIFFSSKQKLENGYIVDNEIIKKCEDGLRKHILNADELKIKGVHNYENICSSLAATKTLVPEEKAVEVIKKFTGVEHRIEFVKEINNVKWYNDSASTSPTRAISAINAFNKESIILISGGADKNLDYTPIAKPILKNVRVLILMGETAGKIFDAVKKEEEIQNKKINIYMAKNLEHAIEIAKNNAKQNEIVLFSPASTSFDMFKNMYDRGNQFKNIVNKIV